MKVAWIAAIVIALGSDCVAWANDNAGWNARVDALLLAPKVNGPGFGNIFRGVPDNVDFIGQYDGGLQGGVRFVLGKENCDGFGVRFQYFHFDNDVDYRGNWENGISEIFDGRSRVDVHAIDIEATQRATFRSWDLVVGGGLRQGSVALSQGGGLFAGIGSFYGLPSGVDFDGVGPTFSISAERPLGCTNVSLVGRARTSLLFGDIDILPTFGGGSQALLTINDEFVQVTEFQFGLNYDRALSHAKTLTVGVFWEAQRWDSDTNFLGDLALHGLSIQSGLSF
ncbi:Lpg1974 family pore-forming outer membrane protein [Botrimarina hoheduenensis]|uniref:Uncharacterized protein n=1 Tax=Botrimarina hoheduenensis TaxID=2528000 RepID=A0A5C5WB61_9BACT|nr:hypothetical protein [Botrimarina hoheduenensis]TWT47483.1 hypothetical protein Pla111_10970 [Botrimarina hoheduenensis]